MKLTLKETAFFGMLGSIMFASKLALEFLPNVHLLAIFTVSFTYVFRTKALFPIYIYQTEKNKILLGFEKAVGKIK